MTRQVNMRLRGIPIPDRGHLEHNRAALRVASGTRGTFASLDAISLLFVAGATRGGALYDWDFEEVVGLDGPVAVAVDQATRTSYTASRDSAALVTLQVHPLHPTPYTLHPTPYTPYTLHPTPYTLHHL